MYKFIFLVIFFLNTSNLIGQPASWSVTNTSQTHTILVPAGATINGVAMSNGDYIGVFFDDNGTLKCGGKVVWTGNETSFFANGDDNLTAAKDGFSNSETFQWKAWRASDNVVFDMVNVNYMDNGFFATSQYGTGEISELLAFQAVLPVELIYFSAKVQEATTQLIWETATEKDNQGFSIEHSLDGEYWVELDFIEGYGTTQLSQEYEYLHENPSEGLNYYRLKQVDFDDRFEYSNVLSALFQNRDNSIVVYPNPTTDYIQVENIEKGNLLIYNTLGHIVSSEIIRSNQQQIDLQHLTNGIYIIQILTENNELIDSKRIIKH